MAIVRSALETEPLLLSPSNLHSSSLPTQIHELIRVMTVMTGKKRMTGRQRWAMLSR